MQPHDFATQLADRPATLIAVPASRTAPFSLLVLVLACACGPTERESGHAIMLIAPLVTILGLAFTAAFRALWMPLKPALQLPLRQSCTFIAALALICLPLLLDQRLNGEWLPMAFIVLGASYLSYLLVAIRILATRRLARFYRHAIVIAWLPLYPTALYFAVFGSAIEETSDLHLQLWLYPGYVGLISGPLFLLLLGEVLFRRHRHHQKLADEALPQPLPVARARIR